ncbi:hypothetical protein M0805_001116 [Coniferiporia weirii]|nr:hypothetical protein M0805_001116 [Coniferiporia weirii]
MRTHRVLCRDTTYIKRRIDYQLKGLKLNQVQLANNGRGNSRFNFKFTNLSDHCRGATDAVDPAHVQSTREPRGATPPPRPASPSSNAQQTTKKSTSTSMDASRGVDGDSESDALDEFAIDIGKYRRRVGISTRGDKNELKKGEDRQIRAPLAPPTQDLLDYVHYRDDSEEEERPDGEERPVAAPVKLSWVFKMLQEMTRGLRGMHFVLGQTHGDVTPANMLWYKKGNGRTVYMLNDFDSGYTGRLNA